MAEQIEVISRYSFWELFGLMVAIIIVVSAVLVFFQKCYQWLESWRKKKNGIEDEKENIEKRVAKLEENDKEQMAQLDKINSGMAVILERMNTISSVANTRLKELENSNIHRSVISYRSHLYRLHAEFMKKQEITMAERELFDAIASEYVALGGNSIFKSKIIPEVEALPIKD